MSSKMDWEEADRVKRWLFHRLRELTRIDYADYKQYRQRFASIPNELVSEWNIIENEYARRAPKIARRLRGYLFEVLFYFACLDSQAIFLDAEIAELTPIPPWMEATPLYDIIPYLHHTREERKWVRRAPQTTADFIVSYVDDTGPSPPSLVDVKSRIPKRKIVAELSWQVTAAMRRGFIFQVTYPKKGIEFPKNLAEWEVRTPCSSCHNLSANYEKCDKCGKAIFGFSLVSAYYEKKKRKYRFR